MASIQFNDDANEIELYIDGKFRASWHHVDIPEKALPIICQMIEQAVGYGEDKKAAEIRKALNLR